MAITHVQTQTAAGTTTTATVTLTLTASNAVIVTLLSSDTADINPVQTLGDTLTLRVTNEIGGGFGNIYQFSNYSVAGGSTTFTFTFDVTSRSRMWVSEFSGLATTNAFDVSATSSAQTSTSITSGTTVSTTQADEVAYAAFNPDGSGTTSLVSMSNSFIVPTNGDSLAGTVSHGLIAYKILTSVGAQETTMTWADSGTAWAMIGTYKAPATSIILLGAMSM